MRVFVAGGISLAHAGEPDLRHFDRWALPTIRLRTQGTDHLLAAAEAAGVSQVVAQGYGAGTGYASWVHLDDAASATVLAVEQKARGVFKAELA